ncbi:hypothetical protein BC832DRAFT_554878 [Gaertneriomyces semiglobifer]|nr:hypothetical protein BC832DRAFT_554878 [Gaertneriomyces semiglobifer]
MSASNRNSLMTGVKDRLLYVKIIEARNLYSEKARHTDTFCSIAVEGGEERRTPTVFNNPNPYFSEELEFGDHLPADIQRLFLRVWQDNRSGGPPGGHHADKMLGQVNFPRDLLEDGRFEEEQWFLLQPPGVEHAVSGEVRVSVRLTIDDEHPRHRKFVVTIYEVRHLNPGSRGTRDTYVVCHLLPDPEVKTTQKTQCIKDSVNPVFREELVFLVTEEEASHEDLQLHVSVWDTISHEPFLGHFSIPLGDMVVGQKLDPLWRGLVSRPAYFSKTTSIKDKRRSEADMVLSKAKQFLKAMHSTVKEFARTKKRPHKLIDAKFGAAISFCGHCGLPLAPHRTHYQCAKCKFGCHTSCAKYTANDCGEVGTIRLKIRYTVSTILPLTRYRPFLDVLYDDKFRLAHLFGKVSKDREEAAWPYIKLMEAEGRTLEFLCAILTAEIDDTADPNDLFRANSMASKTLDVYMRYLGGPYLKSALGDIIKTIVVKKVACELDPTRVEKADELERNRRTLLDWNQRIMNAIYDTRFALPSQWRPIFAHIQQEVMRKFPNDSSVRYTAVSGFIFLRFFAPAILGPKLFDLVDVYVDAKTTRTLTLLAKTTQNLANLVPFGEKEPYMQDMNAFIIANSDRVMKYIDGIAAKESVAHVSLSIHHVHFETAREAARLFNLYVKAAPNVLQAMTKRDADLIRRLAKILTKLTIDITAKDGIEHSPFSFPTLKRSYAKLLNMRVDETDSGRPSRIEQHSVPQTTLASTASSSTTSLFTPQHSPIRAPEFPLPALPKQQSKTSLTEGNDSTKHQASPHEFAGKANAVVETLPSPEKVLVAVEAPLPVQIASPLAVQITPMPQRVQVSESNAAAISIRLVPSRQHPVQSTESLLTDATATPAEAAKPTAHSAFLADLETALDNILPNSATTDSSVDPSATASSTLSVPAAVIPVIDRASSFSSVSSTRTTRSRLSQLPSNGQPKLDSLAIMAMLSNARDVALMHSETELTSTGRCVGCKAPVLVKDTRRFKNSVWHRDHFCCKRCEKIITDDNDAFLYKDSLYCGEHMIPFCCRCDEGVEDRNDVLVALGLTYHRQCFTCGACGCQLEGGYIPLNDMPFCKEDYLKLSGLMCGVCGDSITGEYVEIAGRKYHIDCKRCDRCRETLANKAYFIIEDEIFCQAHIHDELTCSACDKVIAGGTGQVVRVAGRSYHPGCFKCAGCDRMLWQGFYQIKGVPKCHECYLASF